MKKKKKRKAMETIKEEKKLSRAHHQEDLDASMMK